MKNNRMLVGIILVSFAAGARMGLRFTYFGPFVNTYTDSAFLIAIVLSLGPFISIFMSPFIGKRSDRTWTRFGRRRPYLMVSIPLVSFLTILFPYSTSYTILMVLVIVEALIGAIIFPPLFSLIPDNYETEKRGKVTAIFILVVNLGGACAAALGYKLWAINYYLLFYAVAAVMLVFGVASFFFIKEAPFPDEIISRKSRSLIVYFKGVLGDKRITLYYIGDFFRWFGKALVIQMVTLFAANELGVEIGLAGQTLLVFNLVKIFIAIPSGMVTDKVNKKSFLLAGTVLMGGSMYYGWCANSLVHLFIVMGLLGISMAITIISGSALLMDLFPKGRAGEFMGMNLVTGCIPSVLSLWISGALIDMYGSYRLIFLVGFIAIIISFIFTVLIPIQKNTQLSSVK